MRELVREAAEGDGGAYLNATIQESLRHRPVLPNAAPRLTMRPYELGGWEYPAGVVLSPNAYLVHHDPDIYPDPYTFRPERFLDQQPGTYTWLPFGGGRRRCLGASFAQLEMRVVLDTLRRDTVVRAAGDGGVVAARRRSITIAPRDGARVVLEPRRATADAASAAAVPAAA
jgi:cytochrome P450